MVCSFHALELLNELSSVDYEDVEKVKAESRANQEIVRDELVNMRAGYPALMKQVDSHHCQYFALKQLCNYYHELGEKGMVEEKHLKIIMEELDHKISVLKLKKDFNQLDSRDLVLHS